MPGSQVRIGVGVTGARGAASEVDKLRDKFTKLQKQGAKGLVTGFAAGVGIGAINAVGTAISKVTGYLGDSADAFREDELSQQKLTTSLRANATAWDGTTQAIEKRIEAGQQLGFSDDEQRSSLAELVAAYGDVSKALDVMRTAEDLARFSGVDLATASDTLIKVHAGNYRALKSLGINTANIKDETSALAAVQKVAKGQAADYAQTLTGKLSVAEEKAAESSEKFGKSIAKLQAFVIPIATDAVDTLANAFEALTNPTEGLPADVWANRISGGLAEEAHAADNAADAASGHGDALIGVRGQYVRSQTPMDDYLNSLDDITDAEKRNIEKTKAVAATLERIQRVADTLPDKLDALNEAMFGGPQRKGDIAQAQQDLADLLKTQPKKGTRDWLIWAGDVAAAKQSIFDLQFQMKQTEGPEALDAWLRKQRDALGKADGKARDYLNSLIAINSLNLGPAARAALGRISGATGSSHPGGFTNKGIPEAAEGGIVKARPGGTLVNVGEAGKDEAIVPLGKGIGGSTTININVSTPALTPGGAQELARFLTPVIAREMQRGGLIPRSA